MPGAVENHNANNPDIESRIVQTGSALKQALGRVLQAVPGNPQGPQALARRVRVDKVLASRVLRAVKSSDEISALHRFPGPEPLRRLLREAARLGVDASLIADAERAVDAFDGLIRDDLGDRAALDAIIAAWIPEARRDFQVKWKQSAYKAMSQLKGVRTDALLATAVVRPSADGSRLDLVWVSGLIGLQRLRPGTSVRLATRRMGPKLEGRRPVTLDGRPIQGLHDALLEQFCSQPYPKIRVHALGEVVHYMLDSRGFGPDDSRDIVLAEVNYNEMPRQYDTGQGRQAFMFAEVSLPARTLQFDVIVHQDVFRGSDARLRIYDTVFEGVADVNDRSRDIDLVDLVESVDPLGSGIERLGSTCVPQYGAMITHVFERLGWDRSCFRAYRCRIDCPLYGSQVALCFDLPKPT
ncbi:MAG: hypothetical protein Kow0022_06590 [Phycisphaerales bacterium]